MSPLLFAIVSLVQPLPPPFPRDGATLVLENDQVLIWDVSWKKGKATPLHEHRHMALSVTLRPGRVKSTMADGSSRIGGVEEIGNVQYGGMGLVHREEGVSDVPRRVILIELKETTPPPSPPSLEDVAPPWPREGATRVLDNERVDVWDYVFQRGRDVPLHFHRKDHVMVVLEGGTIQVLSRDGESRDIELAPGDAVFVPRGEHHREAWVEGAARVIVVELEH